jgi:uncharacterized membrane-anchored protein
MLAQLQQGAQEANKERVKNGYPPLTVIGWAAPPHYNRETHKLYWAKELQFGSDSLHTLNYNIRVLGRRGVLVLNAVAPMNDLAVIERDMQNVLGFVEFNEGHRYSDYLPGKDKAAEYGIGGLILGAVAVKAGLFKLLFAGLIAAKKLIIAAVIACTAWARRVMSSRKAKAAASPPAA